MIDLLITVGYIVACVLLFALAILVHEFGHFIVALKLGLNVEAFSIGFGPTIWKKKVNGVEYRLSWIPLGGYVSIPDVDPEGTKALEGAKEKVKGKGEGGRKAKIPAWKELLVAVAGPMMNVVLAVVLAVVLSLIPSARFGEVPAIIGGTFSGGAAEKAGLKVGDKILFVGGHPVETWTDMQTEVQIAGGKATVFTVEGADLSRRDVAITPERNETTGAYFIMAYSTTNHAGAVAWMPNRNPLKQLAWDAGSIFRVLKGLVTPKEAKATAGALGGPVMIAEGIYASMRRSPWDGLGFLRFLNVNLAILNLLPIPVLDGGLILFALLALVFRRRVPDFIVKWLSMGFMYLLIGLMGILILKDSWRSWKIHTREPIVRVESRLMSDAAAERLAREKLAQMTLEEKVSLCGVCATMYLNAIPRVGIDREWAFSDCSHCMKPEHNRDRWGYIAGVDDKSTALPCLSALASTWNLALAARHGDVMGSQMRARDKSQMLGPGVNIMRNPLCGRNWEYMSEDPFVAARMVVPLVRAVQEHGVACTPKHFCLNSQELNRFDSCSTVDDRALHEIYLPAFEAVIREGGALALMTAYNKYNGTFCSENAYLQKALLRERWGFRGTIVTDWGGQHSCDNAVMSGGGIEANCGTNVYWLTDFYGHKGADKYPLATAVKEGRIPMATVDAVAMRVLFVMAKTGFLDGTQDKGERLTEAHRQVAREIGEEAIVLAKNSRGVLPLDKANTKKLVVFGQIARLKQAEFGSSCECHVLSETTFLDGLRAYCGKNCEISYYPLGDEVGVSTKRKEGSEKEYDTGGVVALTAAAREPRPPLTKLRDECALADAVLVFTGTTMGYGQAKETEGEDRPNMQSASGHDREIAEILSWKLPRVIVICRTGSALELPWVDACETMLITSYLGQEAGHPMAKTLFGEINPSGKLTYSWPKRYVDTPVGYFGARAYNPTNSVYLEGIYVGYRWYEKRGVAVDFPFGHGLSYTRFDYGAAKVKGEGDWWKVMVPVKNVGARDGAEVVQLYVAAINPKTDRPVKELKGFAKVFVRKGETALAEMTVTSRDLAYWDSFSSSWRADAGDYELCIGSSSADIRTTVRLTLSTDKKFAGGE